MRRRGMVLAVLFVTAGALGGGGLRSAEPAQDRQDHAPAAPATAPQEHLDQVEPGDLLILTVPDLVAPGAEYIKPLRVDPAGAVALPVVKEPLKVQGLTLAEVETAAAKALVDAGAVPGPLVWVDRMESGRAATVKPGPIAPDDVVRVSVVGLLGPGVEQVRNLHVSEAGNVGLPFLGQTKLAGLSESDAEAAVLRAYRDTGVIEHTLVSVLRVKLPTGPEPIPQADRVRVDPPNRRGR